MFNELPPTHAARRRAGTHHIDVVDTHTAGEPTRIAIRGMPVLRGDTLVERRDHFRAEFDELRQALLWEPRGHRDMFGAILTTPTNCADLAAIFMDADGYLNMCIHGSIGLLTAALELGLVLPRGPLSEYTLETPAGIVPVRAKICGGRVEEITVRSVASFLWAADTPLTIPRLGTITIDVAYAGNWFVLVAAREVGIELGQTPLGKVLEIGRKILAQARRQILIDSGLTPPPHRIDLVEIYADMNTPEGGKRHRNIVIFGNGQYDRSPCGTGTCARMAALYARGELKLSEPFVSESANGGVFTGTVRSQTKVGHQHAVLPEVTGSAWVTGFTRVVIDPRDALGKGFLAAID